MTADDARKPMPKPVHEPESEDDEDTMPMTTSKKPPKPKPIPNVELTSAQIIELFRLDVARHDRDVAAQENDDIYDECIDEDALAWDRESESYFSWGDEYLDEEDDEEELGSSAAAARFFSLCRAAALSVPSAVFKAMLPVNPSVTITFDSPHIIVFFHGRVQNLTTK